MSGVTVQMSGVTVQERTHRLRICQARRRCHYDKQWGSYYHFQSRHFKSLEQKSQRGIALTFFIEIVDKRWGHTCTIDEYGKGNNISQSQRKGPF